MNRSSTHSIAIGAVVALASVFSSTAQAATATFSWSANPDGDGVVGYKLYYDTDSGQPYEGTQANEGPSPIDIPVSSLTDPSTPEVTITGLPSCTHFYFALTAYNASDESDLTDEIEATLVAKPEDVSVSPTGPNSLQVSWSTLPSDDEGEIPTYRLYYDIDAGEPYEGQNATEGASPVEMLSSSLSDPATPSFMLTGLTASTTHYIGVASVCDDDTEKLSDEATGDTLSGSAGSSGQGGSGGSAGSSGQGGSAGGSAGAAGSGAEAGAGGETGGTGGGTVQTGGTAGATASGGTAGQTAGSASTDESGEDSGCSCRVHKSPSSTPSILVWLAASSLFLRRTGKSNRRSTPCHCSSSACPAESHLASSLRQLRQPTVDLRR